MYINYCISIKPRWILAWRTEVRPLNKCTVPLTKRHSNVMESCLIPSVNKLRHFSYFLDKLKGRFLCSVRLGASASYNVNHSILLFIKQLKACK